MTDLKKLAPYLPYQLQIVTPLGVREMNAGYSSSVHIAIGDVPENSCKPAFRPLSEITEHHADVWGFSSVERLLESIKKRSLQYHFFEELFEGHWDVFNGIEEGWAVDKNII